MTRKAVLNQLFNLIQTGARRGEVLGLTWSDIDFENRRLSFKKSLLAKDGEGVELSTTKTASSNRNIFILNYSS